MKNFLICVSGLTPQIITETFYCLAVQRKIKIDEVYVITTSRGRNVILGHDKKNKLPPLKSELESLCTKYRIELPRFEINDRHIIVARMQDIELTDIRDDTHNRLMPNKICEVIREKTSDRNNVLYCSVSGGRKTMSVDMAFALSLFGREHDKLYHVLTDEKNEFKGFYPKNKSEDKQLLLSEIPYVRLRPVLSEKTKNKAFSKMSYTDIVDLMRREIKNYFVSSLKIDPYKNEICYGENEPVRLRPGLMAQYRYIIEERKKGKEWVTMQELSGYCKLSKSNVLSNNSKINNKIREAINDIDVEGEFVIFGPEAFGPSNYGIRADKDKFKII